MSIPPLVCNTPPPPDQCEDEKEDFDLHYSLSQEDEDELDYQNFSTYDNYKPNINEKWEMASEIMQDIPSCLEDNNVNKDVNLVSEDNVNVKQIEEELNLEDLNLRVEPQESNSKPSLSHTDEDYGSQPMNNSIDEHILQEQDFSNKIDFDDKNILKTNSDSNESFENAVEIQESTIGEIEIKTSSTEEPCLSQPSQNENTINIDFKEDDFGDFEDFKGASAPSIIHETENPWENSTLEHSSNGKFEANFESFQAENIEHSNSNEENVILEEDDDFGDFESSTKAVSEEACISEGSIDNQADLWNLGKVEGEAVFLENVNKLLESVFVHELPESELVLENNLEASLGEAWRYLIDTDERQPYMVAWNSSCGQNILLKALCIDSRNILFGPKWSSNMPKYAVTMSNAPLQPQKHAAASNNSTTEDSAVDKQNKQASTWVDPFTTDGQESCNSEKDVSISESKSSDVDMFATCSTKSNNIFANTISIQPIRQISLPDTHIFTPTDSETPRSKTIHYDNSPTILLPKNVLDKSKSQIPNTDLPSIPKETTIESVQGDDYWEFQDFKGTTEVTQPASQSLPSVIPTTNVLRETQILQPVKVEFLTPTLNWPEPGEVKETFDDFSDFISKTTKQENSENPLPSNIVQHSSINSIPNTMLSKNDPNQFLDDDFDTFQSALPQSSKTSDFATSSSSIISNNNYKLNSVTHTDTTSSTSQLRADPNTDIDSFFAESLKYEGITQSRGKSITTVTPSNLDLTLKDNIENIEVTQRSMPSQKIEYPPMNILQPTPVVSNSSSQKAGQILQPLSLESYSQINWPNPGIDLQDLSKFNPVESLQSLKSELGSGSQSKNASPMHNQKVVHGQVQDDDWGEFISSKPKPPQVTPNPSSFVDDDEWSDFMSSPVVKPMNGLNTISLNVHTNSNFQKNSPKLVRKEQAPLDIPTLNYITPKSGGNKSYNVDRHLQRL